MLQNFVKIDSLNPICSPTPEPEFICPVSKRIVRWSERNVLNPAAVVKDGKVHLFYRAQDAPGTSRIGLATSSDGLQFVHHPQPVFFPDDDEMKHYEWNYRKAAQEQWDPAACTACYFDGVEDPRIVMREDGRYFMTYTAYDGKTARLAIASSSDLLNWTKHGLVLAEERYSDTWSKAGSIVTRMDSTHFIAAKINGKYWMYYGDTNLFMATSEDLVSWEPAENSENGQRIAVLHPRTGYFDSRLVEPGPQAILSQHGILLIYNGSNADNFRDPTIPKYTYAAGQALFDKNYPYKLIDRSESFFIHPDKSYEKVGEVNEVCFVEGLVHFREKWFLYYGTADSKIAVAVSDDQL